MYCWNCGTEVIDEATYCHDCGSESAGPRSDPGERRDGKVEEFFQIIEDLVDSKIERCHRQFSEVEVEHEVHVERHVFALKMYIIGSLQGQISTQVYTASRDWEERYQDVNLTPVNERIGDMVEAREDEIRAIIEPNQNEDSQV